MSSDYIIKVEKVSKTFPGVKALNEVDFELKAGEVLALCGENGAGKSTLMKTIAGVHDPDPGSGCIQFLGKEACFENPLEARKAGIVLVFQELSLVPELSVAENIFLGSLPRTKFKTIDWKSMNEETAELLEELECNFKPTDLAGDLSIAQQQMVEIARSLPFKPKVVILDEPTSSLTEREKEVLFKNIRRLKEKDVAIVYITHKMDEVFEITDRITVLRDGQRTGSLKTSDATINDITKLMIGRELEDFFHKSKAEPGKEILRVENLTQKGEFQKINFSIRSGEVLGVYGLVGAGRSEMAESIFGVRKLDEGKIFIEEKEVEIKNSKQAVKLGIGFVPENRKEQGLVLKMSCQSNLSLAKLPWMHQKGFIDRTTDINTFNEYKEKLLISTPGPNQPVVNLSGGNQQKIVIGKWMCMDPKVLILDEPTRGIDVGAKAEIHKLIAKMAEAGLAVLVISSEMPEIIGVSNRIITMKDGCITAEFQESEISEQGLIDAITLDPKAESA